MIRSFADGRIEDTGPLTRKRMETVDEEFLDAALGFMDRSTKAEKPFFIWFSATRMHVWTHLKPEYQGKTGIGLYPDGMVEHDDHVGMLLAKLDELGIADNTIVMYSTDNGAEIFTWPDGGQTRFWGSKGSNKEGGHVVVVERVDRQNFAVADDGTLVFLRPPGEEAQVLPSGGRVRM